MAKQYFDGDRVLNTTSSVRKTIAHFSNFEMTDVRFETAMDVIRALGNCAKEGCFNVGNCKEARFVLRRKDIALAAFDENGNVISYFVILCLQNFNHFESSADEYDRISTLRLDTDHVKGYAVGSLLKAMFKRAA